MVHAETQRRIEIKGKLEREAAPFDTASATLQLTQDAGCLAWVVNEVEPWSL